MRKLIILISSFYLVACASVPESIEAVDDFELNRYLGQWYEIARLDHRFERGLEQVTANYSLNTDGTVKVTNKGFSTNDREWEEAEGKARFAGDQNKGHLEVSFFGPFYGDYVIFELEKENYQYAFVTGSQNSLWFLSRTPTVSETLKEKFINDIVRHGYKPDELIFVNQK